MPSLEDRIARLEAQITFLGNTKIRDEMKTLIESVLTVESRLCENGEASDLPAGFTLTLTIHNPRHWQYGSLAVGGMAVKNIRLHLALLGDDSDSPFPYASLMTPTKGMAQAFDNPTCRFPPLPPGTAVKQMTLCSRMHLEPGQSQALHLHGRTIDPPLGQTHFRLVTKAFADPDLSWLFPQDQNTQTFETRFSLPISSMGKETRLDFPAKNRHELFPLTNDISA